MTAKVLIVDDSKTDVALIQTFLADYEVQVAWNGQEAMDLLRDNPDTDLMILDLNMPVMNGFEEIGRAHV